jgi:predicted enzyme related to lactoylglutathione lyase
VSGELSWFELGVGDTDRARAFYGGVFGWTFEPVADSTGSTISTPNVPGGLHGGDQGASPLVFFGVADIDGAVARVRALGGEADELDADAGDVKQRTFGRFALCRDDQGSGFGIHQPPSRT